MNHTIDEDLLAQARSSLSNRDKLFWIIGGAGSGKTTICTAHAASYNIPVYDMDAHIYGAYHGRFTPQRHPVNTAWSSAANGLAWLLDMGWEEFNNFNQAALPEYLDLLAEELAPGSPQDSLLIDGGIWHPALLAQVIPAHQIVCLAITRPSSASIWQESAERESMKQAIYQLPNADEAWLKFLEFDRRITATIMQECQENKIPLCTRSAAESVHAFAQRVATALALNTNTKNSGE